MAKRVKEESNDEDYEFVPPDFDEDAFIHKEMVGFRTTSTLIAVGIVAALLSWLLYPMVGMGNIGWFVGLAIFGAAFYGLKILFKALKFDISHYGRREWLGNGFLLFFTWLAFFMIFLNPPISDYAEPEMSIYASPSVAVAGKEVRLDLFVSDNDAFSDPTFLITDSAGRTLATQAELVEVTHGHYQYTNTLPAGSYTVQASTTDDADHMTQLNMTLGVLDAVVDVRLADLTDPTEELFVQLPTGLDIYGVYADMDGDVNTRDDRVWFEYREDRGGWEATANYRGWKAGANNFTLIVEEKNRFEGLTLVQGGIIKSGPFEVNVDNPGDYKGGEPKRVNKINPPTRQIPGLEVPIIIGGLAAIAIARRK